MQDLYKEIAAINLNIPQLAPTNLSVEAPIILVPLEYLLDQSLAVTSELETNLKFPQQSTIEKNQSPILSKIKKIISQLNSEKQYNEYWKERELGLKEILSKPSPKKLNYLIFIGKKGLTTKNE